jgi:hypothetical protein
VAGRHTVLRKRAPATATGAQRVSAKRARRQVEARLSEKRRRGNIYVVWLQAEPGADGIRALKTLLKLSLRRFRLRCLSAREEHAPYRSAF